MRPTASDRAPVALAAPLPSSPARSSTRAEQAGALLLCKRMLAAEAVEAWRARNPELVFPIERERPAVQVAPHGSSLRSALSTIAKLGSILFIAYGLMFNFSVVRGSSMAPGIHDGDRILVDHLSYVFKDVARGDIVVLQYPLDPSLDYIKRVIGLPGDVVRIDDGRVFVNGSELAEPYIAAPDSQCKLCAVVESEHYFVLGDNRRHSSDSREFGQVPRQNLRGKVDLRVWPPLRAGTLQ